MLLWGKVHDKNPEMHLTAHLSTAYHAFDGPFGSAISTRALHRATLS